MKDGNRPYNNAYYCIPSVPLKNPSGNVQKIDLYSCRDPLSGMGAVIGGRQWEKESAGRAAVSENWLLEQVAAI
jgi:hypothetical protein